MAVCEQGYLCEVCGQDVGEITESDLYLRYVLGEVDPETLHKSPERHILCNPTLAQFIVAEGFAPVLAANGGGTLVNMLSAASWRTNPRTPGYAASKAAEWSLTNALRLGMRDQGTVVIGVHVGFVDTDATERLDVPKVPAAEVAEKTMDGIVRGDLEVLVDEAARRVHSLLSGPLTSMYPQA